MKEKVKLHPLQAYIHSPEELSVYFVYKTMTSQNRKSLEYVLDYENAIKRTRNIMLETTSSDRINRRLNDGEKIWQ